MGLVTKMPEKNMGAEIQIKGDNKVGIKKKQVEPIRLRRPITLNNRIKELTIVRKALIYHFYIHHR